MWCISSGATRDVLSNPSAEHRHWIAILAAALAISLSINVWFANTLFAIALIPTPGPDRQPGERTWRRNRSCPRRLRVCVNGASAAFGERGTAKQLYKRAYIPSTAAPSHDAEFFRLWSLLGTRYIVSLGAASTEDRIIRSLQQSDQSKVVLRHVRNVTARDFQHGNHVLFGSTPNNPWTALFEDRLNFRFARERDGAALFVNASPAKGEALKYDISQAASVNAGRGYARVAFLPNFTHTGFVLLVTGLNMVTAEAAGEFATSPAAMPTLLDMFGAKRVEDLPYFELLLRTAAVDNVQKLCWSSRTASIMTESTLSIISRDRRLG
jgi:hypothetical protein